MSLAFNLVVLKSDFNVQLLSVRSMATWELVDASSIIHLIGRTKNFMIQVVVFHCYETDVKTNLKRVRIKEVDQKVIIQE